MNTETIRKAVPADAPRLAALCGQLGYTVTLEEVGARLAAVIDDPRHALFAAAGPDGTALGWVHALVVVYLEAPPFVEIGGLVVDADYRRTGLGNALMARAEEWAAAQGVGMVRLRSNVTRGEAHAFYRARGYEVSKTQYAFVKLLAPPAAA